MNKKSVSTIYGTLSGIVWFAVISLLVFAAVLFFIGEKQTPVFCVNNIILSPADTDDGNLAGKTVSDRQWYKAEIRGTVTGAVFSPYTYTAESVAVKAPENLKFSDNAFVCLDAPLTYSKTETDDFVISYYIKADSLSAADSILRQSGFGLRGVKQHYAFLEKDLVVYLPGFMLSDSSETVIELKGDIAS